MQDQFKKIELPEIKYSYNALEPVIIGDIVMLHHQKHHRKYVDNYNMLVEKFLPAVYKQETVVAQAIAPKIKFNAGGVNCHNLYWDNLAPTDNGGGILPDDKSLLTKAITAEYGSYSNFMKEFNEKGSGIEASGWCWLAIDPTTKALSIEITVDQDHVEQINKVALLTVDAWEHAYYLQYKNEQPEYFNNVWKVINWRCVEDRFNKVVM